MRKKSLKNITAFLLAAVLLLTSGIPSYASSNTTYFGKDATADDLAAASGWDTTALNAAEWEYTDSEDETTTIERVNPHTEQYYYDIIKTTKEYLGISDTTSGSGGAAMAAVALQEYETWLEESAEGIYHGTQELNRDNNVKYNTWYYGGEVSGEAYAWCCVFVSWCANECGFLDDEVLPSYSGKGASGCTPFLADLIYDYGYEYYPGASCYPYNTSGYEPVPGDLYFFCDYGMHSTHIGIVVDVGENGIIVVEGNHSDHVSKTEYAPGLNWPAYFANGYVVHVEYPATSSVDGVYSWLIDRGYTAEGASALMGIMNSECGLWSDESRATTADDYTTTSNPWYRKWETTGNKGLDGLPMGFGLIQWSWNSGCTRRVKLFNFARDNGYDYNYDSSSAANSYVCLEGQLEYLDYELQNSYPTNYEMLTTPGYSIYDLVYYTLYHNILPGDKATRVGIDTNTATEIYNTYNG